jgi:glycosyltransferase involved in cell wall biosynthesis
MSQAALVVHTYSYPYIKNVARFIHETIKTFLDDNAALLICETVDAAPFDENTLVFVIGEKFAPFERRAGCTYIYLNFSVVTVLGRSWETGLKARRAIRTKRQMLTDRLPTVDIVLDYFPPQTRVLQRDLNTPVLGFTVATPKRTTFTPMKDRAYDVCFVGGLSQRRQVICDGIAARKMSLSPSHDIDIEDAAAASRVCLNVHSVKSHHLEIPRFVAALASGTPVVSEPSLGIHDIFDPHTAIECPYERLPQTIERLLAKHDALEALGRDAQDWHAKTYLPRAQSHWKNLIENVLELADATSRNRKAATERGAIGV